MTKLILCRKNSPMLKEPVSLKKMTIMYADLQEEDPRDECNINSWPVNAQSLYEKEREFAKLLETVKERYIIALPRIFGLHDTKPMKPVKWAAALKGAIVRVVFTMDVYNINRENGFTPKLVSMKVIQEPYAANELTAEEFETIGPDFIGEPPKKKAKLE
jgi:hypothetical protein